MLGDISCVVITLQLFQTENELILLWVKVKKIGTEYNIDGPHLPR